MTALIESRTRHLEGPIDEVELLLREVEARFGRLRLEPRSSSGRERQAPPSFEAHSLVDLLAVLHTGPG